MRQNNAAPDRRHSACAARHSRKEVGSLWPTFPGVAPVVLGKSLPAAGLAQGDDGAGRVGNLRARPKAAATHGSCAHGTKHLLCRRPCRWHIAGAIQAQVERPAPSRPTRRQHRSPHFRIAYGGAPLYLLLESACRSWRLRRTAFRPEKVLPQNFSRGLHRPSPHARLGTLFTDAQPQKRIVPDQSHQRLLARYGQSASTPKLGAQQEPRAPGTASVDLGRLSQLRTRNHSTGAGHHRGASLWHLRSPLLLDGGATLARSILFPPLRTRNRASFRGVPQLVEAHFWVVRVAGSNPASPTIPPRNGARDGI